MNEREAMRAANRLRIYARAELQSLYFLFQTPPSEQAPGAWDEALEHVREAKDAVSELEILFLDQRAES